MGRKTCFDGNAACLLSYQGMEVPDLRLRAICLARCSTVVIPRSVIPKRTWLEPYPYRENGPSQPQERGSSPAGRST